jgi:hypothetical protein
MLLSIGLTALAEQRLTGLAQRMAGAADMKDSIDDIGGDPRELFLAKLRPMPPGAPPKTAGVP